MRFPLLAVVVLVLALAAPARAALILEFQEGQKLSTVEMDGKRFRSTDRSAAADGPRAGTMPSPKGAGGGSAKGAPRGGPQRDAAATEGEEGEDDPQGEDEAMNEGGPGTPGTMPSERRRREQTILFDGEKQVLYQIEEAEKTYQRVDERTTAEVAARLKQLAEEMKASLPPEQRAAVEKSMADQQKRWAAEAAKTHTFKFERASGSQRVGTLSCENYRVLRDGKLDSEVCFVPWGTGGFAKSDFQAFQELGKFTEKLQKSMSAAMGGPAVAPQSHEWMTRMVDLAPGFPAVVVHVREDGTKQENQRLVKIQRGSVPSSRFVVPADYRETKPDFGDLGGGSRRRK